MVTSPTMSGALAEERARADDRDARIRAEGWRAGAEAMREAAAVEMERTRDVFGDVPQTSRSAAKRIRSLDIPEDRTNG